MLVVLTVIGVYENVAVSCQHVSASEKVTRQESSSATTQAITTFSWSLVALLTLKWQSVICLMGVYQQYPQEDVNRPENLIKE